MKSYYKTTVRGREREISCYNHSQMNRMFIHIRMKTGKIVREKTLSKQSCNIN